MKSGMSEKAKRQSESTQFSRRKFLRKALLSASATVATPVFMPASVIGKNPPSDRIIIGCIGTGGMGMNHVRSFANRQDCHVAAVCDVDQRHLARALKAAGLSPQNGYVDYLELLSRDDLDAVVIATPDHWHVPIAMAAVRAGKDVYCEKPLSHSILEGRRLVEAVRRYGSVFQTGSQQRSNFRYRYACELVRNGKIGELRQIQVWIPENSRPNPVYWRPMPVPPELDYDRWLGPAPAAPYTEKRCHYSFRFIRDYSGGQLTNWGAHDLDIAQWALDADHSGPIRIYGRGEFPQTGLFNTATRVHLVYEYANGVTVLCRTGSPGVKFIGTEGWIYVNRGTLKAEPSSVLAIKIRADEVRLPRSRNHIENFLKSVRNRQRPIADVEIGHRSATVCHLGNIAMLTGQILSWNPVTETFEGDEKLNRWLLPGRSRARWAGVDVFSL